MRGAGVGIARRGTGPASGELWGPAAQAELDKGGWKPTGNFACIYLAVTICYTSIYRSKASEPRR